jgi:hypothetical protein
MFKNRKIDWTKLGMIMQSNKTEPSKVKKEYDRLISKDRYKKDDKK